MADEFALEQVTIGSKDGAELLGISPRHFRRLAADGHFGIPEEGRYSAVAAVQGFARHIAQGTQKDESQTIATDRLREAQIAHWTTKAQVAADELVAVAEVEVVLDEVVGAFREGFQGFSASITDSPEMKAKLDSYADRIFIRAAANIHGGIAKLRAAG